MSKWNKPTSNRPEESQKQTPVNIQEDTRETLGNERMKPHQEAEQPQGKLQSAEAVEEKAPELTSGGNR